MTVRRPALRYMGGKFRLAPRILAHFPPHETYVEPYGGAASLLLAKPRSHAEIYNDLDSEIVNFFRCMRDPELSDRLVSALELTPFARDEFLTSYEWTEDPVEQARRMVVRSFMGHGSTSVALRRRTGFRSTIHTARRTTPAADWRTLPPHLVVIAERLRGVTIENRPALQILRQTEAPRTLAYVDPPYVHATRSKKTIKGALEHAYKHEMSDTDHAQLLELLVGLDSMVLVSGYEHPLYEEVLRGWDRVEFIAWADGARRRREVLWINPAASAARAGRLQLEVAA